MSKNKTENAVIKYLMLSYLSKKLLRCEKVHQQNQTLLPSARR